MKRVREEDFTCAGEINEPILAQYLDPTSDIFTAVFLILDLSDMLTILLLSQAHCRGVLEYSTRRNALYKQMYTLAASMFFDKRESKSDLQLCDNLCVPLAWDTEVVT